MAILSRILDGARSAARSEDGNSTIEFVVIFPALITLFLMVFETGMLMTRGVMLDRAVDISMREVRLGTLSPMTTEALRDSICDHALIIPDCQNVVQIEMRPISKSTWGPLTRSTTCVDRTAGIQPALRFTPGIQNEMMTVKVCAIFDPFFPTTGLAAQMSLDASGGYALVAMSAFVNEP